MAEIKTPLTGRDVERFTQNITSSPDYCQSNLKNLLGTVELNLNLASRTSHPISRDLVYGGSVDLDTFNNGYSRMLYR
jgi:hypothetical protein